jgi:hypothetical protein
MLAEVRSYCTSVPTLPRCQLPTLPLGFAADSDPIRSDQIEHGRVVTKSSRGVADSAGLLNSYTVSRWS